MNFRTHVLGTVCGVMLMSGAAWAQKGETVKIAWIDPLSGPLLCGGLARGSGHEVCR